LLHFISGAGADTSAEWNSGAVSGLETPRAFILVLDGTYALFHWVSNSHSFIWYSVCSCCHIAVQPQVFMHG